MKIKREKKMRAEETYQRKEARNSFLNRKRNDRRRNE